MQAQTAANDNGKTRAPKGRKDRSQQEAVIELDAVRERVEELEALYNAAGAAADDFNDAIKATAEASGLLAAVMRKFVVARVGEKFSEKSRECEQLSLLFSDVGEN